jgi:hypothetical protein
MASDVASLNFAGIPLVVSPHMPENEIWLVTAGERKTLVAHEGPRAGEEIETWLRRPQIIRLVNLGDWMEAYTRPIPPPEIKL